MNRDCRCCHCANVVGRPCAQAAFRAWTAAVHAADGVNVWKTGVAVLAGAHAARAARNRDMKFARSEASSVRSATPTPSVLAMWRSAASSVRSATTAPLIVLIAAVHAADGAGGV